MKILPCVCPAPIKISQIQLVAQRAKTKTAKEPLYRQMADAVVSPQLMLIQIQGQSLSRARAELAQNDIEKCEELVRKAVEGPQGASIVAMLVGVIAEVEELRPHRTARPRALALAPLCAAASAGALRGPSRQPPEALLEGAVRCGGHVLREPRPGGPKLRTSLRLVSQAMPAADAGAMAEGRARVRS